jgi:hypothetical protein
VSWNWKSPILDPLESNLLRTEDGDDSDEIKTRLPNRAELGARNLNACHVKTSDAVLSSRKQVETRDNLTHGMSSVYEASIIL